MAGLLPTLTQYLEAQGIGVQAVNLFYGILSEDPNSQVVLYEYTGRPNEPKLGGGTTNLENPRVQVVARGEPYIYDAPQQKVRDAITAFARVANTSIVLGGVQYKSITHINGPSFMRRDANFRVIHVANFEVMKEYEP